MDEVGVSDSTVFIKVEKVDETDCTSEADINEEGDSFFYCDAQIDVKQEGDALHSDEDTSNDGVIKEGKEDDTESTFPTEIKHEEGSLFCYGGLIPQQVGEKFVPGHGGLSHVKEEPEEEEMILPDDGVPGQVKEEEEMIIPDNGDQDSLEKLQGTNDSDLKTKRNVGLKRVSNASSKRRRKTVKLRKHQCPHCDFTTTDVVSLEKHINARNMSEEPHQCPPIDDTSIQSNDIEVARRKDENRLECPNCDYKAAYPSKLKMHIMACHTGEKPHQCPYCDYTAVQSYNVKTHIMARHAGEKPHQCPHCDYTALKHYSIRIHIMARHTGEKPQQCPHCDYKSVTISCLKKHIISRHMDERPLQCPHCDYKSITSNCLKEHIMARHLGEKPNKCPHCDYRTTQKSNLKSHIKFLHKDLKD